ncbi:unnamed protein product [Adineta ricciae]|uniref:F-box domain-containing protein n=1 Tax=Adineta ricciae TaxID=249248 RepID=A0A814AQH7_ADIRI|nr:unnamed protein product [Adineta ricciae]
MSLNTRNKRRRELREERVLQDGFIFQLRDETLLKIFKYLTTAELITAAGVSQRFRTIAYKLLGSEQQFFKNHCVLKPI